MASNNNEIPVERRAYMMEAIEAMRGQDRVTPAQLETILKQSYAKNKNLTGMHLQMDIDERIKQIENTWKPDVTFWNKVVKLVGQETSDSIKSSFEALEGRADKNRYQSPYKMARDFLLGLQNNKDVGFSDIKERLEDDTLEELLGNLAKQKRIRGVQFGGKKKTRGKRKSKACRKSGKSRKGKGRK